MITHGAMVCDFTSEVRLAWLLRTRSRNAADMSAPYTFSTSSQMAIHNLLKALGFHNRGASLSANADGSADDEQAGTPRRDSF
jgi:hypothetical protein